MVMQVYTPINLGGNMSFGSELQDFPSSPRYGQMELINGVLWVYSTVSGVSTWFPLNNKKNSIVFTQGVASTTWTIAHGLGTSDVIFMAYGADGSLLFANREVIDVNTIQLDFTEAVTGRAVVFADAEQFVPAIQTESINTASANIGSGAVVAGAAGLAVTGTFTLNGGTIPAAQVNPDWNSISGLSQILNKPTLTAVATSGAYGDLSGKPTIPAVAADVGAVATSAVGAANGVAALGSDGRVPSAQLPSYVDDVQEAANFTALPGTGDPAKIYVVQDSNKIYRWSGSSYIEISPSPGSTDSVTEGSTNLYFTSARAVTAQTQPDWSASSGKGQILNKPALATVATSGAYSDLSGKPTIPAVVSALTNDSAYVNQAGARTAISVSGSDIAYNSSTGVITSTPYSLPIAASGTLGGVKVSTGLAVDGSGNLTATYATIGTAKGLLDAVTTVASASGAQTIDCSQTTYWKATLSGNVTSLTMTNVPTGGAFTVTLKLTQGGSGSYTMAYPANTHGALPTLTTTVGKYDYLALVTDDGGSTWTLFVGGLNN